MSLRMDRYCIFGVVELRDKPNYCSIRKTNDTKGVKSTCNEVILHHCPRMLGLALVGWKTQLDDEELALVSGQHLRRRSIPNKCLWVRSGLQKQRV